MWFTWCFISLWGCAWGELLRFTVNDWDYGSLGSRIPAIFTYNKSGIECPTTYLNSHDDSKNGIKHRNCGRSSENGYFSNFWVTTQIGDAMTHNTELNLSAQSWNHIEINQHEKIGKVTKIRKQKSETSMLGWDINLLTNYFSVLLWDQNQRIRSGKRGEWNPCYIPQCWSLGRPWALSSFWCQN